MSYDTQVCKNCHVEKPVSEYYIRKFRKGDAPSKTCKKCSLEIKKSKYKDAYSKDDVINSARVDEKQLIAHLATHGIFAVSGASSHFTYVDVVAWGCIPIELKKSVRRKLGQFTFTFSTMQQRRGLADGLIVLAFDYSTHIDYHVFRSTDPIFYKNGRLVPMIEYRDNPQSCQLLKAEMIAETKEAWGLLEILRQEIISDLKRL